MSIKRIWLHSDTLEKNNKHPYATFLKINASGFFIQLRLTARILDYRMFGFLFPFLNFGSKGKIPCIAKAGINEGFGCKLLIFISHIDQSLGDGFLYLLKAGISPE